LGALFHCLNTRKDTVHDSLQHEPLAWDGRGGGVPQHKRHNEFPAKQLTAIDAALAEAARGQGCIANVHGWGYQAHHDEATKDAANDLKHDIHDALANGDMAGEHGGQGYLDDGSICQ